MDVAADGPVIGLVLDHLGLVASLEEMAGSPPMPCGPRGIAGEERLHAPAEVGSQGPEQQVEVIAHEDKAEHHPARLRHDTFEVGEDAAAVVIVVDDVLAGIAASHDG